MSFSAETCPPAHVCAVNVCVCVFKQHPTALCPPEYMVCFLHRLITAVRACWDEGNRKSAGSLGSEGTTHLCVKVELSQGVRGSVEAGPGVCDPNDPQKSRVIQWNNK